jgi:hypothetical protein
MRYCAGRLPFRLTDAAPSLLGSAAPMIVLARQKRRCTETSTAIMLDA